MRCKYCGKGKLIEMKRYSAKSKLIGCKLTRGKCNVCRHEFIVFFDELKAKN